MADFLDAVNVVEPDATPDTTPQRLVPRDADDDHVLAAALAARAEAIITGDQDLLSVGAVRRRRSNEGSGATRTVDGDTG